MDNKVKTEQCEICGSHVPDYGTVYLSSSEKRTLVYLKCYNQKISDFTGFDFDHVEFEPILIKDSDDLDHEFHFTARHLGDRIAIEAFEIKDGHRGGYEFSVIDNIGVEPFELVGRLIGRIHRALNRKHIYWNETTGNHMGTVMKICISVLLGPRICIFPQGFESVYKYAWKNIRPTYS